MEVFHFHFLEKQKTMDFGANKQKNELFSAFLLGLGFSFGWTPCIGPVLGSVLALAASDGQDALMGAIYLLVYTLGMALPFFTVGLASSMVLPLTLIVSNPICCCWRKSAEPSLFWWEFSYSWDNWTVCHLSFHKKYRRFNAWWKVLNTLVSQYFLWLCCQLVPWINPVRVVWTISQKMNTTTNKNPLVGKDASDFELKGYAGQDCPNFLTTKGRRFIWNFGQPGVALAGKVCLN